ncbi:MAG: threonine synthase [Chloroflexi bacterium]|nr:threonine synthase [Chloroflexota bacterium]MCL5275014.1 threonine synthase [Chloroflexota bacterium]
MNQYLQGFRCSICGATYTVDDSRAQYTCPVDGGNLDAVYDYASIARNVDPRLIAGSADRSAWHYEPLLPCVPVDRLLPTPLTSFGWSPLYRAPRLEHVLDVRAVWLKDDTRLPSSSFKDRASSMVIARAQQTGAMTICAASTGNAASSLVTLCSGTDIRTVIFVPQNTPEGKLAQILIHGARVFAVEGSYDDAFDLAMQASQEFGWYNRNTGVNPYTREGKKTAAYEICEQIHLFTSAPMLFRAPDVVVVPVGDGNIISGLHKGFRDLHALGWIDRMPRFVGVTATLAPALYRAWQSGGERVETTPSRTIASGISVDLPRDGVMALRAVRDTGGLFVEAADEEMLDAMGVLARDAAVFVEPACAAAYVGLSKARRLGVIRADDEVVLQMTGSGLKDVKSALAATAGRMHRIQGKLEEIRDWRLEIGD